MSHDSSQTNSQDSFGVNRSLISALGHACDDRLRFQEGCNRLVERCYDQVDHWFDKYFPFLSVSDREDAMHDFFISLAKKLRTPDPQQMIQEFGKDAKWGKQRFRGYLFRAAQNAAFSFASKQAARKKNELKYKEQKFNEKNYIKQVEASTNQIMNEILLEDSLVLLEEIRVLAKISEPAWKIFIGSFEMTSEQVKDEFELVSVKAVNSQNYRTRKKLSKVGKQILKQYGPIGQIILSDADSVCTL